VQSGERTELVEDNVSSLFIGAAHTLMVIDGQLGNSINHH
jgi:hypothetical protein